MSITQVVRSIVGGGKDKIWPSLFKITNASRLSSTRVSALLNRTMSGLNTSLAGKRTELRPP